MKKVNVFKILGLLCVVTLIGIGGFKIAPKLSKRPDITVVGYVNMVDGLGRQGPELIDAFRKELKVDFRHTRKIKGAKPPKRLQKYIEKESPKWGKVLIFEDILWGPWDGGVINKIRHCPKDTIKIAYSMYEATKIPDEWVAILNGKFDAVIVPSKFLIKVYQDCGVHIPIFHVPLGLDLKRYLSVPLKKAAGKKFVFGNLSAGSDRKNHTMLVRAFAKAFGDDPTVELRINARYAEKEVRNELTKVITLLDLDNITFIQRPLNKDEYLRKFREIDCYVSPSKGEGFSIQPREAMALGIPVIATNNTGQTDVCDSGLVEAVNSPLKKPALNPWGDYYGYNFDCHIEQLAHAMKRVKENYDQYLAKSEECRNWSSQFQYKNLKELYRSIISPKAVVLGNQNRVTEDYIVTNSRRLLKKYKKLFGKEIAKASNEFVFANIYDTAEWGKNEEGKGFSGLGSTRENAAPYMVFLEKFMQDHNIRSVVDLGCGDWTFSQHINWDGIQYVGIDVVRSVIEKNRKKHSHPNVQFLQGDGIDVELPEADLFVCKDVLQHLSNEDINRILPQLKKYKYCLITNDVDPGTGTSKNQKIDSGGLRPLDLAKPPFSLSGERALSYEAHGNQKVVFLVNNQKERI